MLDDQSHPPDLAALNAVLDTAADRWYEIVALVRAQVPTLSEVWTFAGSKVGWSLRLVDKDRILVYLTPRDNDFTVGIVLGKKAVAAARERGLSVECARIIDAAPVYGEGHGVRFSATSPADLLVTSELLAIKLGGTTRTHRSG